MKTKLILQLVLMGFFMPHSLSQVLQFDKQEITIAEFETEGFILDIGGGGEGIIGRLKGSQVIAIDILRSELMEAPEGPLKIVMDAMDLQFLNETFQTVTSFFTLMYIQSHDHEQVFREVFRVLKPGGVFRLWDAEIPKSRNATQNRVVVPLRILLPDQTVETGYGVKRPPNDCDMTYYIRLANRLGFSVLSRESQGRLFTLVLQKPAG